MMGLQGNNDLQIVMYGSYLLADLFDTIAAKVEN